MSFVGNQNVGLAMTKALICSIATMLCATAVFAQGAPLVKKGDRPVFMTVERLAFYCEDWGAINPGGQPPKSSDLLRVSGEQITKGTACETYIRGYNDARIEKAFGDHYHPVPASLDHMKALIDTFLKYSKDHPEKQDFAASTILEEVEEILRKAQKAAP
jgi:hypothetical protein